MVLVGDLVEGGFYIAPLTLEAACKKIWKVPEGQVRTDRGCLIFMFVGQRKPEKKKRFSRLFVGKEGLKVFLTPRRIKDLIPLPEGTYICY